MLILLLILSFGLRLFTLANPAAYIFDEVYHVPAIKAIAVGNPDPFNPFAQAPEPNTAYDWLHPPVAKLIQAISVNVFGANSFGWRFPSALFGTLSIAALYYFTLTVFKKPQLALAAAALFSLDNLQFTMSRIAMNDIFVTTWIILALAFFFKRQWRLIAVFTGLALATKHSALFLYPIYLIYLVPEFLKKPSFKVFLKYLLTFILIPLLIYFLSYSPMFLQGKTWTDFVNLHKQIYYYQTHLTATHGYQSAAWQWPLLIRPVWFHVAYLGDKIANIYNLGNPAIFWGGLIAVMYVLIQGLSFATAKVRPYWFILISYFSLFLPWLLSPRILFLHHYLPALPFLCVLLASVLPKFKPYWLVVVACFFFFYPINTAIPLPTTWLKYWFWLPTWK
ncbi:MAG: glycosyltransferase family 39 protein [Patescibacteria group bacterium]